MSAGSVCSVPLRVAIAWVAVLGVLFSGLVVPQGAAAAPSSAAAPVVSRPVGELGALPADARMPARKSVTGSGVVPNPPRPVSSGPAKRVPSPAAPKASNRFDPATSKVSSRAAKSTDYVNTDGSHTAVLSQDVVNFQAPDGSWQPVSNDVEADPLLPGGLRNKANGWRVHFGDTTRGVSLESAGGSVSMVPVGASAGAVAPKGQGREV